MITLNYRPLACKARTTLISRVVGSWTHTTSTEPLGVKDKKPAIQTFRGRDWWNVFSYQGIDRRTTICTTQRRIWTAFHVRKAKPPFSFEASSFYWRLVDINLTCRRATWSVCYCLQRQWLSLRVRKRLSREVSCLCWCVWGRGDAMLCRVWSVVMAICVCVCVYTLLSLACAVPRNLASRYLTAN